MESMIMLVVSAWVFGEEDAKMKTKCKNCIGRKASKAKRGRSRRGSRRRRKREGRKII